MSGRIVPLYYKGMTNNDDETIPLAKYPTIEWSSDSYINWLTQQAINVPTQLMSIVGGTGSSLVGAKIRAFIPSLWLILVIIGRL